MASTSGTYTDQDDALAKIVAWAKNTGVSGFNWTQNGTTDADGTGYRAHLQKTIDGTVCYINLRSIDTTETVGIHSSSYHNDCVVVNGSTGYNAGNSAMEQPGYTANTYANTGTSNSRSGKLDDLTSGGTYYAFATATSITLAFYSGTSPHLDWRFISFGAINGHRYYAASGGHYNQNYSNGDSNSGFLADPYTAGYVYGWGNHAIYADSGWHPHDSSTTFAWARNTMSLGSTQSNPPTSHDVRGAPYSMAVQYSRDPIRGNAQLWPSLMVITKDTAAEFYPVGEIEGIRILNMANYDSAQQITYNGDTYRLFRGCNGGSTQNLLGYAFLESAT